MDAFIDLEDGNVDSLLRDIRKPGGSVPHPLGGDRPWVAHPGNVIPLTTELNLKLMVFYIQYHNRTSKPVIVDTITKANVHRFKRLKDEESNHKDADPPELMASNWPKTLDAIEQWLGCCLGSTKIPLAYVIRDHEAVSPWDPQQVYPSYKKEMIARAPILDPNGGYSSTFLVDRTKVWNKLSLLTMQEDCWSYVRPAQKNEDGRLAFLGLKGHYLGANSVGNMATTANSKLLSTTYSGERRGWNFERFVRVHVDQHSILEGLVEHGNCGIDEQSKVRILLAGIRTTSLDSVKTRVMSDETPTRQLPSLCEPISGFHPSIWCCQQA